MKLSKKAKWLILASLILVSIALLATIGPLIRVIEFGYAEGCKGYWASLQEFVKQNGRYPKDEAEIGNFFKIEAGKEPVEYIAPHDETTDEVILWWKEKSLLVRKVGITESGVIVKK